jgi:hypothetical protein
MTSTQTWLAGQNQPETIKLLADDIEENVCDLRVANSSHLDHINTNCKRKKN